MGEKNLGKANAPLNENIPLNEGSAFRAEPGHRNHKELEEALDELALDHLHNSFSVFDLTKKILEAVAQQKEQLKELSQEDIRGINEDRVEPELKGLDLREKLEYWQSLATDRLALLQVIRNENARNKETNQGIFSFFTRSPESKLEESIRELEEQTGRFMQDIGGKNGAKDRLERKLKEAGTFEIFPHLERPPDYSRKQADTEITIERGAPSLSSEELAGYTHVEIPFSPPAYEAQHGSTQSPNNRPKSSGDATATQDPSIARERLETLRRTQSAPGRRLSL
jgi:hypothetical protein